MKINEVLYGLKEGPRAWYEKLTKNLFNLNYKYFDLYDVTPFVKKFGR